MSYELVSEECKLCFYRGENDCYELSYSGKIQSLKPISIDVNTYFLKGCITMRKKKINKILK